MTRLLPDTVRDRGGRILERYASRIVGPGRLLNQEELADVAQQCISTAMAYEAAWKARRQIHDDDMEQQPVALSRAGRAI